MRTSLTQIGERSQDGTRDGRRLRRPVSNGIRIPRSNVPGGVSGRVAVRDVDRDDLTERHREYDDD